MYNQKTHISKLLSLVILGIMLVSSAFGFLFGSQSVYAEPIYSGVDLVSECVAEITKSTGAVYYRGQVIEIDLGGTTHKSTDTPDFTAWELTISNTQRHTSVKIDMQQALVNYLNNNLTENYIIVNDFSTNISKSSSGKKYTTGKMTITVHLNEETVQELSSLNNTATIQCEYSVYENRGDLQGAENVTKILNSINYVLQSILSPIIGVVLAVGVVFAIYLGMNLARANNSEQRDEAKKRVIYTIIGIVIGIALIVVFNLFAKFSVDWLGDANFFSL